MKNYWSCIVKLFNTNYNLTRDLLQPPPAIYSHHLMQPSFQLNCLLHNPTLLFHVSRSSRSGYFLALHLLCILFFFPFLFIFYHCYYLRRLSLSLFLSLFFLFSFSHSLSLFLSLSLTYLYLSFSFITSLFFSYPSLYLSFSPSFFLTLSINVPFSISLANHNMKSE